MKAYLGAGVAGLIVASVATGASAHDGKIKLGLRSGYALPAGHISGERHAGALTIGAQKLSDNVADQVPFGVDVGYLVIRNLTLGAYGQYGFNVRTPTNCSGCSAHDLRFGLQGQLHFAPEQSVDPWLGVGFGYELLRLSQGVAVTTRGWELLNLQGGVDFRAASSLMVGPFVGVSLASSPERPWAMTSIPKPSMSGSLWASKARMGSECIKAALMSQAPSVAVFRRRG